MRWSLATLILVALLGLAVGAAPFEAVGVWKVGHGDGTDLMITLYADGRARSDWENQQGSWRWEGQRLVVDWSDGWSDIISAIPGGFEKVAFKPGADRSGPPVNRTAATRLQASPSPPQP